MLDVYSSVPAYLSKCMKIKRIHYQLQTACLAVELDNRVKNRPHSSHTHSLHLSSQHWPQVASTLNVDLIPFV